MNNKMTRSEERELLALRATLAQLKIEIAQAKKKQERQKTKRSTNTSLNLTYLANATNYFMSNQYLLKIAMLPTRWKHRLLLGGVLVAWQYYQSAKQHQPITHTSSDDVIDITPEFSRLENK